MNEYQQYLYKKDLRKTANGLGIVLLTFFALEIILSVILVIILRTTGTDDLLLASSVLELLENGMLSALLFFLLTLIYVLVKKRSIAVLFPFDKIGAKKLAMLCVIGTALCLMCNMIVGMVTDVFGLFGLSNSGGSIDFGETLPSVLMYYLTVAVVPACMEEFAFRGVIMGSLRKYSDGLAVVVSAALFALMHGNFVQIPFTFCCGLVFGMLVLKTNSLLPSILVHFLNNFTAVTFELLEKYQVLPDELINILYFVLVIVLCALALIFVRKLTAEDKDCFKLPRADDGIPYREKLKKVASSPTLISFAVIMVLFAVFELFSPLIGG